MNQPEHIETEEQLDDVLTRPDAGLTEMMGRLDGDIMILGIGGKMGLTLGGLAVRAVKAAGAEKRVIGVSRFSEAGSRELLESWGLATIACDLLEPDCVNELPRIENIIYMAGRKFGTHGAESLTWAMNTVVPSNVGRHFRDSRIVVFSSGAVYGRLAREERGDREDTSPRPRAEYGQSVLGRERVFEFFSRTHGTPVLQYRLYYAIDLRYGVLYDIGRMVWDEQPIPLNVDTTTAIWQGDANAYALRCLEHAASPPVILNVGGREALSVADIARRFGQLMDRDVRFEGEGTGEGAVPDVGRCERLFGEPVVTVDQMVRWQADWIMRQGRSLDKPTGFQVVSGDY